MTDDEFNEQLKKILETHEQAQESEERLTGRARIIFAIIGGLILLGLWLVLR